jgi:RNA polymerase sigma-70 factor (ECF subfamily)
MIATAFRSGVELTYGESRMVEAPTTQPSLLVRLRDPRDATAWTQFVDLYAPLVYGHARRRGLQDADAADLTQIVLRAVASSIGRFDYDPQRGSFRGWLLTIVHRKLCSFLRPRHDHCQGSGDSAVRDLLESRAAPEEDYSTWDAEFERRVFAWAVEQVRPLVRESTWQAFWQTAVENRPGKDVAAALGLSLGAVYLARSRVMARLRAVVQQAQESDTSGWPGEHQP